MTQVKSSKGFDGFDEYIAKAMSFDEYLALIDRLLEEGKSTGPEQDEERFDFSRLNRQRMKRLAKTVEIESETADAARLLTRPLIWLVLTEGWCGDAAQNLPVIEKIAAASPLIKTLYILRDDNLDLMDRYLTNGGRAIPRLICIDAETLLELGDWGSRPKSAQDYFLELRAGGMEKSEIGEKIQRWYLNDRESSIQKEFVELLKGWA